MLKFWTFVKMPRSKNLLWFFLTSPSSLTQYNICRYNVSHSKRGLLHFGTTPLLNPKFARPSEFFLDLTTEPVVFSINCQVATCTIFATTFYSRTDFFRVSCQSHFVKLPVKLWYRFWLTENRFDYNPIDYFSCETIPTE